MSSGRFQPKSCKATLNLPSEAVPRYHVLGDYPSYHMLSPNHVSMFKVNTVNCGFDSPFVRHDYLRLKSIMGHYSVMCLQSVKTTFRTPMTPPLTPAVQAPVARQCETIRIDSRWNFTSTMECSSKGLDCYNSVRFCCIVWRLPYVFLGLTRIRNPCFGIPHNVSVWPCMTFIVPCRHWKKRSCKQLLRYGLRQV